MPSKCVYFYRWSVCTHSATFRGWDDPGSTDISCVMELSGSETWPRTPAQVPRSPVLEASASAEIRCAALSGALSSARYWASVVAASLGLLSVLAVSGDRKEDVESNASVWLTLNHRRPGSEGQGVGPGYMSQDGVEELRILGMRRVDVERGSSHLFLKSPIWRVIHEKTAMVAIIMKTKKTILTSVTL
ncbi:hypothetical protein EDB85DRAFT_1891215 [Lactarius pseudohatsudake]|nr:hypothetical protein EDB85DRAFT_1891215 [Lactarius pseudohatsudake]